MAQRRGAACYVLMRECAMAHAGEAICVVVMRDVQLGGWR